VLFCRVFTKATLASAGLSFFYSHLRFSQVCETLLKPGKPFKRFPLYQKIYRRLAKAQA
jgi:hypothetical protein